ncbi:hypothetical protein HPG69_009444 [Diceros bicornis minor]|uniref:EF-hand domain-containing protein n=1 Tax=Diceros bicornis minor TaxID=77932 RepID=A0A7J7F338_DICBM|nr:hypothetical protein HPG69_009444 [Diceros bicornis minor]
MASKEESRKVAVGRTDIEDLDLYATSREKRFRLFASIECEGQLFMTPYDFILAVTTDEPKCNVEQYKFFEQLTKYSKNITCRKKTGFRYKKFARDIEQSQINIIAKTWKSLSKQELNQMLSETPPVWKGSSKLFRSLKEREIVSKIAIQILGWDDRIRKIQSSEGSGIPMESSACKDFLSMLNDNEKPHAGFRIAFNMFDTDGNEMVDKKEFLVLQEIFRKKNEKRETKGDEEKRAMLVRIIAGTFRLTIIDWIGHSCHSGTDYKDICYFGVATKLPKSSPNEFISHKVLKTDAEELVSRSYWDTLRRNTSQALFSDLAERADDITSLVTDTTLLVHFFGKKGKAELNFEDFYRFMDNLQTEVLEIEFLSYSNGMNTISEEDFAHILLRYTNVENTSIFLENVRYSIPEEKGITFDEFRSFFQFLNNLEDFAIALNMYNFASRSIGQDEFKRAVYVATGLKLSPHLVNTVFKIFDVDKDDQLSYKEFIGIMKDRLHRGFRGYKTVQKYPTFKSCLKKELHSR